MGKKTRKGGRYTPPKSASADPIMRARARGRASYAARGRTPLPVSDEQQARAKAQALYDLRLLG